MIINSFLFNFETKNVELYSNLIIFFSLLNILILSPDIFEIFAKDGLIKESINAGFIHPYYPSLNWFTSPLEYIGVPYGVSILLVIAIYVISLVFNIINFKKLLFAIVACFLHIGTINSSFFFFIWGRLFHNIRFVYKYFFFYYP